MLRVLWDRGRLEISVDDGRPKFPVLRENRAALLLTFPPRLGSWDMPTIAVFADGTWAFPWDSRIEGRRAYLRALTDES